MVVVAGLRFLPAALCLVVLKRDLALKTTCARTSVLTIAGVVGSRGIEGYEIMLQREQNGTFTRYGKSK